MLYWICDHRRATGVVGALVAALAAAIFIFGDTQSGGVWLGSAFLLIAGGLALVFAASEDVFLYFRLVTLSDQAPEIHLGDVTHLEVRR